MKTMLRTAMAVTAMSLATPALAFTVWPDVDFEWYANVGKYDARPPVIAKEHAPRAGYIWTPAHWETRGLHQNYVAAHWVVDDFVAQTAIYNHPIVVAEVTR